MGMMSRMRSLAPWFIITVGGLFVAFMVLSDSKLTDIVGRQSDVIGEVNDQEIKYSQFSSLVEQYRQAQEQQGNSLDETQMEFLRDQVWDQIVNRYLVSEKVDELSIQVSDEEVSDAIMGSNPQQYLNQQIVANFIDSTGVFNRSAFQNALLNPQNEQIVIQIEEDVRSQILNQKLQSYLNASVTVSEEEIKRQYFENSMNMSAVYVMVDVNSIPDSSVTVTQSEIEEFYNDNKDDYKVEPKRKVDFVLFRKEPSAGDSSGIVKNLNSIVNKLQGDTNTFKTYVEIYSDQPYAKDTIKYSQLSSSEIDLLSNAEINEIVGPVLSGGNYIVYRLADKVETDEEVVRASHILLPTGNNPDSSMNLANLLYRRIKEGEDFASLAKQFSGDPGNKDKGGDLGWFGKNTMVKPFEEAAFAANVGEVTEPVKTNFGYHIIKVTGKSDEAFVVEKIVNKIAPSMTTLDNIYQKADNFSYLADKNGFEKEAELMDYNIVQSQAFTDENNVVPGLGVSRAAVRFAFDNDVGSISQVFRVSNGYAVVKVSEVLSESYTPIEEVEARIKAQLIKEKKLERAKSIASKIREKIGDGSDLSVARSVYPQAKIETAQNVKANGNVPGIGTEHAFAQYALNAELNQLSNPVVGSKGAYLIKVTRRTEFSPDAFAIQRDMLRNQILQQKKSRFFASWIEELKEEADIVDNRYKFYR